MHGLAKRVRALIGDGMGKSGEISADHAMTCALRCYRDETLVTLHAGDVRAAMKAAHLRGGCNAVGIDAGAGVR